MLELKKFVALSAILALIAASPLPYDAEDDEPEHEDAEGAESDHLGRVQIKVFRGPTEHDGDESFAPWGYWVKQPADDHR